MRAAVDLRTDPFIRLHPSTTAWHRLTIAVGIGRGGVLGGRARERGVLTGLLSPVAGPLARQRRERDAGWSARRRSPERPAARAGSA